MIEPQFALILQFHPPPLNEIQNLEKQLLCPCIISTIHTAIIRISEKKK